MAKAEWGTKRQCPKCGTRFYDLQRNPIVCISCGAQVDAEPLLKSRRLEAEREAEAVRRRIPATPSGDVEVDDDLLVDEEVDLEADDEILVDEDEDNDDIDVLDTKPSDDEDL